jgi:F0F1-type ATP synthase membrane subunit b/b'
LAIEKAPPLSDREVVERLARLEEGQQALRQEMQQLRTDMNTQMQQLRTDMNTQIQQLRTEMNTQIQQLRTDMNAQFARIDAQFAWLSQLMMGIVAAFAAIVTATIGFALWDRKTMTRPLENRIKVVEEEIAQNRSRLHAFLEALRTLSAQDQRVAEVLRKFDLL